MSVRDKINSLYKEGKISGEQALKAAFFIDDFEKQASVPPRLGYRLLEALAVGGAIGAGGGVLNKIVEKADDHKQESLKINGYRAMLDSHPNLRMEDQETVQNTFNTLAKFAPSLAADPYAAGGYVKRILQFDPETGSDYNVIKTLVDLEKNHQQAKSFRIQGVKDLTSGTTSSIADQTTKQIMGADGQLGGSGR